LITEKDANEGGGTIVGGWRNNSGRVGSSQIEPKGKEERERVRVGESNSTRRISDEI